MKWENTTNEEVLQVARDEIWKSWRRACADNADHPRVAELFDPDKLPALVRSSVKAIAVACSSPSIRSTSRRCCAQRMARLIARVVLPTPPFTLPTAIVFTSTTYHERSLLSKINQNGPFLDK